MKGVPKAVQEKLEQAVREAEAAGERMIVGVDWVDESGIARRMMREIPKQ